MPSDLTLPHLDQIELLPPITDAPPSEEAVREFAAAVLAKLTLAVGKAVPAATDRDWFIATALALRDRVIHRWLAAERNSQAKGRKRVYYLSLEFLLGRLLNDVVENLRMTELVRIALGDLGVDPERMRLAEPDAALGNGGLGRLAACLMDSMTTACFAKSLSTAGNRNCRNSGCRSAIRGNSSARRSSMTSITAARSTTSRPRAAAMRSGAPRRRCRRSPTTRRSSAGAAATSILCGYGRRARPTRCGSMSSTKATMSRPLNSRRAPRRFPKSSTPPTTHRRGRNYACGRNISLLPPRSRT